MTQSLNILSPDEAQVAILKAAEDQINAVVHGLHADAAKVRAHEMAALEQAENRVA